MIDAFFRVPRAIVRRLHLWLAPTIAATAMRWLGNCLGQRLANAPLRTMDLVVLSTAARRANLQVRKGSGRLRIDVPGQASPVWAVRTHSGITLAGSAKNVSRVIVAISEGRLTTAFAARGVTLRELPPHRRLTRWTSSQRGLRAAAPNAAKLP